MREFVQFVVPQHTTYRRNARVAGPEGDLGPFAVHLHGAELVQPKRDTVPPNAFLVVESAAA